MNSTKLTGVDTTSTPAVLVYQYANESLNFMVAPSILAAPESGGAQPSPSPFHATTINNIKDMFYPQEL